MLCIRKQLLSLFILCLLLTACRTAAPEPFEGYDYDPEGVTETHDRKITQQHKRTTGFLADGVWISNEFVGARVSDVYKIEPYRYRIEVHPEISPINNSPWYAFKIWSDEPAEVEIELVYQSGRQRYIPKISNDGGKTWTNASNDEYTHVRSSHIGRLKLSVSEEPIYVSAQELFTSVHFNRWLDEITEKSFASSQTIGLSHEERELKKLLFSVTDGADERGVIIIYGRQHPPEVPGYIVSLIFLETLAGDTELATKFRNYFDVWAFPFMNPDGADNGHWRTNATGVDLNRDWHHFRQPETAAVKNQLMKLHDLHNRKVFYGIDFHSTGRNIFYPIKSSNSTFPDRFTFRWADEIRTEMPELSLGIQAFDTDSPIAKNWTYKTFGADAVTFEVWDEIPRSQIEMFGKRSAEIFMEMMLDEYYSLHEVDQ
ncbi:MAG: hypothetical protein JJU37_11825 [Balneolaceae bacterium]|nr:hypothetical protein [Balneolaceae bacterium]